ncbi:MAG: 1-acyl-sn-glycerol-3-phosphate acyltransferase [Lachnospiraceae bacterium]|nr:1-acyl-sn-glycerol-3-phosphate acyltransferase [Lachnospiraceae bacterium]
MQHSLAHYKRIVKIFRPLAALYLKSKFRLKKTELPELPETFLLICNHATNYDAIAISVLLNRPIFYVATEHIFSLGWISRFIDYMVAPIPRPKGGQAAGAVMEILRRIKEGGSVGLFAEGNCSWDGLTASFAPATGKMVRASGTSLVTCRLRGGYFAYPRWAYSARRGPVWLEITHIVSPEELKKMKPDQINALIADGIREDAYETRKESGALYPGRRLAEGLENALLFCPRCHSFDTLRSKGSGFSCTCGLKGCYDEKGFLTAEGTDFTTIREWNAWQQEYLGSLPISELPTAEDTGMKLMKIDGHERSQAAEGDLTMDAQTFRLGDFSVPVADIVSLDVRLRGTVSFLTRDGGYYEIKTLKKKGRYRGRKYQLLYQRLQKEKEAASV